MLGLSFVLWSSCFGLSLFGRASILERWNLQLSYYSFQKQLMHRLYLYVVDYIRQQSTHMSVYHDLKFFLLPRQIYLFQSKFSLDLAEFDASQTWSSYQLLLRHYLLSPHKSGNFSVWRVPNHSRQTAQQYLISKEPILNSLHVIHFLCAAI